MCLEVPIVLHVELVWDAVYDSYGTEIFRSSLSPNLERSTEYRQAESTAATV